MTSITDATFFKLLKDKFPHDPTAKQSVALQKLASFVLSKEKESVFMLKGFAGTGKTTIVGTIVTNLWKTTMKAVLMAPTGRAAKVMSNYSGTQAFTIHRKIYFPKKQSGGGVQFVLSPNKHRNTIFIVDEASMIPDTPTDSKLMENGSLLDDLLMYVYSGHNCKLILIGDTAQLPPVHLNISPALDENQLALNYNKEVIKLELDEVVRQAEDSGILVNATNLREQLQSEFFDDFKFSVSHYTDIVRLVDGNDIQEAIDDSYSQNGKEETAIIVRSNKRANLYNENIRNRILYLENELATGDYMMVVKNNYFWLKPTSEAGFIANGDIIEVLEIFAIKELYGFKFAEVKVKMVDYPNQKPFETVLLLDTIMAETPSLSYDDGNRLYQEVMKDYADEKSKYKKFLAVKNNKFFNALQVKFSYAITCHKSQGGQWNTVFVEQPYLPNGIDKEYLRWLYTAVTRAKHKLYLIGFKDDFFVD
ncbi:ATP-dependent DNA helicase [Arenibacter algicola]|jgi:exodeoxyribonuclease-5|uniref:ATP-dependent RecD-like DNA helicase n=1 Tax=Arenibacter algicola TaxID=616991 RepID=A0A221UY74_9FLAO|nr:ATP-binding domain-containing protein [Arenibacter algicola]ASO06295.1 ATP-dependent RecD-like DNA helicase [Arenibacter algicola]|tara:strand:+ start:1757 stop:3190 length:1434 start_codon:yes stop_codon:yes gene_type:complete